MSDDPEKIVTIGVADFIDPPCCHFVPTNWVAKMVAAFVNTAAKFGSWRSVPWALPTSGGVFCQPFVKLHVFFVYAEHDLRS